MLTSLRLINFKNHEDTLIEGLKPLSVFVGPNAAGKSSILEGADSLYRLSREHHIPSSPEIKSLIRFDTTEFTIEATGDGWSLSLSLAWSHDGWEVGRACSPGQLQTSADTFNQLIGRSQYLRLRSSEAKKISHLDEIIPHLNEDGYGLATVIANLMQSNPSAHQRLTDMLRELTPNVEGLRVTRAWMKKGALNLIGEQLLFDTVDGRAIPAALQSDGTIYILALLTILSMVDPPRLILLDDVETGLHPKAQRELVPLLKNLVGDGSRVQLLMTTHSPYIVDGMEPEEVWVCGRDRNQRVRVKRLSDLPNVKQTLEVLTTGELWGELGEDWVGDEV